MEGIAGRREPPPYDDFPELTVEKVESRRAEPVSLGEVGIEVEEEPGPHDGRKDVGRRRVGWLSHPEVLHRLGVEREDVDELSRREPVPRGRQITESRADHDRPVLVLFR